MELRRLLVIARPWLPYLAVLTILAGVSAYALSSLQPKTYEARTTLIVGQSLSGANPDYNQLLVSQRLSMTYAAIATTRPVLESVIRELDLQTTPEQLAKRVEARAQTDSTLVALTARDSDPDTAASIANELARQLIASTPAVQGRQSELQAAIDAELRATREQIASTDERAQALVAIQERTPEQEAQLASLENRLVSLRSTYATLLSSSSDSAPNLLSVIEPAVAPIDAVSPRPLLNALLAAALGLLVALGVAAAVTYLRDVVRDPDEVYQAAGVETLGTIARMPGDTGRSEIYRLATLLYPRSDIAETYRILRANIEFAAGESGLRTLLVASPGPGEGKSVTAANLAVVFAQAGRRVLLVDADLRKPGTHLLFDLPNTRGLTTLLSDPTTQLSTLTHLTEQGNLAVLTTGPLPPNPAELVGSRRMRDLLERLREDADLLVLDSPPLLAVTDAAILSSMADATLLVIDASRSRRRAVRAARTALVRAGAKVIGVALNRVPRRSEGAYYGYGESLNGKDGESRAQGPDASPDGSVV